MEKENFKILMDGADKLNKPWRTALLIALIALIATNAIWGLNFAYLTKKAYEPAQNEVSVSQDFASNKQEYKNTEGNVNG